MEPFEIITSLVAIAVNTGAALYILSQDPRKTVNRLTAICLAAFICWSIGQLWMSVVSTPSMEMWGARIAAIGWCSIGPVFLHLCIRLTGSGKSTRRERGILIPAYTLAGIILVLVWTTHLVFDRFDWSWGSFIEVPGPLRLPTQLFIILLVVSGLAVLMRGCMKSPSVYMRTRLGCMLAAVMVPIVFGVFNDTLLPLINKATFVSAATISPVMSVLLVCAVTERDLVKIVLSRFGLVLMENIRDAIFITDSEDHILLGNPGAAALTGFAEDELKQKKLEELLPAPAGPRDIDQGTFTNRVLGLRWCLNRDGARLPVTVSRATIRKNPSMKLGAISVLRDMRPSLQMLEIESKARIAEEEALADRKRLEEARDSWMSQSNFMDSIIESIAEPLFIKDRNFKFVRVNRAFSDLLGCHSDLIIGRTDYDFFPSTQAAFFRQKDTEIFESGEVVEIEEELIRDPSGTNHIVRILKAPLVNESGTVDFLVGILSDITSMKELEQLRLDFIRTAAHELRTPLTSLMLGLDALTRETSGLLDSGQQRSLEVLTLSIQRMNRLARNLLDLANLDAGAINLSRDSVDLPEMIDELAALFEAQLQARKVTLQTSIEQGAEKVSADPDRLFQILHNLLGNSIKYTENGRIVIGARKLRKGMIQVSVKDTGVGIPVEMQRHIFSRFAKVNNSERSPGLGLSIARSLVEAHGGRIWMKSSPGKGSTFFFSMPAAD